MMCRFARWPKVGQARPFAKIGKRMPVEIRGKTQTGVTRNKAQWTCRCVLDVGWKYGGSMWGVKPGQHAKFVNSHKYGCSVLEVPDEEENSDSEESSSE